MKKPRKVGSGRKLGTPNKPKIKIRPKLKIKSITLDFNTYIGAQLKQIRKYYNYTLYEFSSISGIEFSLIAHFENRTGPMKTYTGLGFNGTAIKYIKALGIKEVVFKL